MVEFEDWVGDPDILIYSSLFFQCNSIRDYSWREASSRMVGITPAPAHTHMLVEFFTSMFGCCDRQSRASPAYAILWAELQWLHV